MHFELNEEQKREIESLHGPYDKLPPISVEELEIDCEGDEALTELLKDMLDSCLAYTITVAKFKQIVNAGDGSIDEAREEIEKVRGNSHDATIASINALSRALGAAYRNNSWAEDFGGDRTKYMRFALTLTLTRI